MPVYGKYFRVTAVTRADLTELNVVRSFSLPYRKIGSDHCYITRPSDRPLPQGVVVNGAMSACRARIRTP